MPLDVAIPMAFDGAIYITFDGAVYTHLAVRNLFHFMVPFIRHLAVRIYYIPWCGFYAT